MSNDNQSTDAKKRKGGRCWTGYEPVPGKKPYSPGSCRPEKSGKSKPKKK